jgi:hypothetical protein
MIHVFGTQWSHWGNTYMINTETFEQDTQYVKVIEHLQNINFVRKRRARISDCVHDMVYIDHGNPTTTLEQLSNKFNNITHLEFDTSYLQTLSKWVNSLSEYDIKREQYVWVCSSMCDYTNFDFTWSPDPFQSEQLHVFPSKVGTSSQKLGDTFFINLADFKAEVAAVHQLQVYTKQVNYIQYLPAQRLKAPVIEHEHDSQAAAIIATPVDRTWPYYEYINKDTVINQQPVVPILWDKYESEIIVANSDASRIIVPTVAIDYIHDEVYDYHNILHLPKLDAVKPLDIIFFSNGEPNADENYEYLQSLKLTNRIVRSDRVVGRIQSQLAAANLSTTPWYFLVNAKLKVSPDFDFTWQPDRLQRAKHYIFTAFNPVNNLEYGHQAIVANNRLLTLNTKQTGLDFTMSSPHEVVEMNSGTAYYNTDPWTAWRTAFREVVKLCRSDDLESLARLDIWLTMSDVDFSDANLACANDGFEYYTQVNGDFDKLKLSYEWDWLRKLYEDKYNIQE